MIFPLQPAHVCAGRGRPHRRHACRHLHLVLSKGGEKVSCNKAGAEAVGKEIARLAKEKSIEKVVFDRNGYLYHGKIKAVADGAREGGLEF